MHFSRPYRILWAEFICPSLADYNYMFIDACNAR